MPELLTHKYSVNKCIIQVYEKLNLETKIPVCVGVSCTVLVTIPRSLIKSPFNRQWDCMVPGDGYEYSDPVISVRVLYLFHNNGSGYS